MKKFLLVLLLLIVLIIGGLIAFVAYTFSPDNYATQVQETLSKLTGRNVSIGTGTKISWNPEPTITLNDVRLDNIDKSQSPFMLQIKKIQITVAWSSLLKNPLVIKSLDLTKPQLLLERLGTNQPNFDFDFLTDPNFFQTKSLDILSENQGTPLTKIEKIYINEGQIIYRNDVSKFNLLLDNINGKLSADSIRGPFKFSGTALWKDKTVSIQSNMDTFQILKPIPVSLAIKEKTLDTTLSINGDFTPTRVDQWFSGSLTLKSTQVDSLAEFLRIPAPGTPKDKPFTLSSSLIVSSIAETLKGFVITFGEGKENTALTGTLTHSLQGNKTSYQLEIAADTFQPADCPNYIKQLSWDNLGKEDISPVSFKIQIEDIPLEKEHISKIHLNGKYESGKVTFENADAILPGNTKLSASGTAGVVEQIPSLDLSVQAETENLETLLAWAQYKSNLNLNIIKKANLVGKLSLTPGRLHGIIQSLKLDDSMVKGQFLTVLGEKPTSQIQLAVSNLNWDKLTGWTMAKEKSSLSDLPLLLKQALEKATWANDIHLTGSVDLSDITLLGLPISNARLEGSLIDNILKLDQLSIQNMVTTNMSGNLTLNGIGRPQLNVDNLRLSLEMQQLPLLLEKANLTTQLPLFQKATNATLQLTLKGGRNSVWDLDSQGSLSDITFKLAGSLTGLETSLHSENLSFDITHPNFQNFITSINPTWKSFPKLDGAFKFKGKLVGSSDHFAIQEGDLTIGLQKFTGNIDLNTQNINTLTADISSPSLNLNRILAGSDSFYSKQSGFSQKKFDFSLFNDWKADISLKANQLLYQNLNIHDADLTLALNNKELSLTQFKGKNGDKQTSLFDMTAKLDWSDTPRFETSFTTQDLPIRSDFMVLSDLSFGNGSISIAGELKAQGNSPSDLIQSLNGKGTINLQNAQLIGVNISQMIPIITRAIQRSETPTEFEPEFKRVLHSGKTPIQSITGDFAIADGTIRMMDLTLKTTNATANPTQIVCDLPKRTLNVSIPVSLNPLSQLPPFILGVSVTSSGAQYQPSFSDLSATLSNQSKDALANTLKQQQEAAAQASEEKRQNRVSESKKLTTEARNTLNEIEKLYLSFPFEKGNRLLQSSRDAMTLVNQLSVLEDPTDAQLIQQIEQARLVLLKAQEFKTALSQETNFNTYKKITAIRTQAHNEVAALKNWAAMHSDISLLQKLSDNASQNLAIIEKMAKALEQKLSQEQIDKALSISSEALTKIDRAYQHASRFDLSSSENEISAQVLQDTYSTYSTGAKKAIQGSFTRPK